jgi:hypothetical protein
MAKNNIAKRADDLLLKEINGSFQDFYLHKWTGSFPQQFSKAS